jgi:hypothetical protein
MLETFRSARTGWIKMVTVGLLLLLASSAVAMIAVWFEATGTQRLLELGFVAGPGGQKLWLLTDLLHTKKILVLASLTIYALGIIAVMWPERVGVMGIAGIGRLIACIAAVAAIIFAVMVAIRGEDPKRLAEIHYFDIVRWLMFIDMGAMVLANMRIAGIAARGGYPRLSAMLAGLMVVQVAGMLMLMAALSIKNGINLMWASAFAYAGGAAGVCLLTVFLMLRLGWELLRRRGAGASDSQ